MPRIKAVKVTAFNSVQDIADDELMMITRYPSSDLSHAVEDDHWCEDFDTCDITVANENGFAYVAAGLLSGATEVAHVDAVCYAHNFNKTLVTDPRRNVYALDEWTQWEQYFKDHARMCESCGGSNWDASPGDDCGHCSATLLYQNGDEVEFYLGNLFPEEEGERADDLVYAIVFPADKDDRSLVKSGVIFDDNINPDFWLHVETPEGEAYDIRASYLENPIVRKDS